MSAAVVFATGPVLRWVLPAVTAVALIVAVLKWVVRELVGGEREDLGNLIVEEPANGYASEAETVAWRTF